MAFRTLWNTRRFPEKGSAMSSCSASLALEKIYQGLEEQRRVVNRLKRYEDILYCAIARRLTVLQQELAALFGARQKKR